MRLCEVARDVIGIIITVLGEAGIGRQIPEPEKSTYLNNFTIDLPG
jgi:hypothetical protein